MGPASSYPHDVARVLSYLANLIDGSLVLRGVGLGRREFAAQYLEAPPAELVSTSRELGPLAFQLAGLAFAEVLREHPPLAVIGEDMDEPPRWEQLSLGERSVSVPYDVTAAFAAGTIAPCALAVTFDDGYGEKLRIRVWSRSADVKEASDWLEGLIRSSHEATNPFRNRIVSASVRERIGLWFAIVDVSPTARSDVILSDDVWNEIERSVFGLFARREQLQSAGLSTNRGLLLAGPPGTGKTAVCRAIATELAGDVTVVFCDAVVVSGFVKQLYRELDHLAPALVVMEDLDLIIGRRGWSAGEALNNFLLALDGAMTTHAGVVTVATTNDPGAIDDAARRAGRFDAVVRVDVPDTFARAAILRRYIGSLGVDVDVDRVAAVTEGWTGADLRELVTRAVLDLGRDEDASVTLDRLLQLVRERPANEAPGCYL